MLGFSNNLLFSTLLVDGKDNSVRRRIDIEPDHVAELVDERGVFGELELPGAVQGLIRPQCSCRRNRPDYH